ncbi:D-glycero-alpha-D-manno-heptose-1,7-bisphosphate 7-phosphatase [Bacteroidia bacterium]|nr:D-glycero-alpha-D-manno-heptose-1,7-bisphosphate 7-phosphatase [Bacteroidia bacterium]
MLTLSDIDLSDYETLFLDRDGIINRLRPNDYVKCWEEFEFLPGILEALTRWNKQFKYIFIVTNQRGIGKGVMTVDDLEHIHHKMLQQIVAAGGRIDKIYYCPAVTDSDPNRKPNIGMALQARQDFPDIDFTKSVMIGDSDSDMQFAANAGMHKVQYIKNNIII